MKIKFFIIYFLLINHTFADILFSEIFPNTVDDKNLEYIELYNSGDLEKSLSGFILKDKIGKEYIFSEGEILGIGEKKKYLRTLTKIILNNFDEELFLNDNLGTLVDSYNYNTTVKGEVIIIGENNENEEVEESIIEEEIIEEEIIEEKVPDIIIDNYEVPDVIFSFQRATYLLEKEKISPSYTCDTSKEACKINLDFRNSFTGDFSENDFECETDFGFTNDQENRCNPSTIIVPVGTFNFKIKIVSKETLEFSEKSFSVINNGYIKPVSKSTRSSSTKIINMGIDPVVITKPNIIVQSGLNEKNECSNLNNCNLNFKYIEKSKYEKCHWDFGLGTFEPGTNTKCDPGYVKYGKGEFVVKLRVFEKGDYNNFEIGEFIFWNGVEPSKGLLPILPLLGEGIEGVQIYGVMPNPVGSDNFEYIELINNTDENFNLKGCSLDDIIDGGSKQFVFEKDDFLKPGEIKKYLKEITKLNLNNDSDEVNLICNNELIDILKRDFDIKSGYYLDHSELDVSSGKAKVIDIIDGDTIKIQFIGSEKIENFRLVGVDTPETKHPNMKVEQYGQEAYEFVLRGLKGKEVFVELDSNNIRDTYSRLLGFVFLDGENFNKKIIEEGYSRAYLDYDFIYKEDFIKAEKIAEESGIGIWGNYEDTSPLIPPFFEEGNNVIKSKIIIQGKIGSNKKLDGNILTCYDTCSVNFDGRESTGNIKKYSWDFGNGEKFEGQNPGYIKYQNLGNYKVYLAIISDSGELNISEFYVNFIKTPKKQKASIITKVNAEDSTVDILELDELILDEETLEEGFNYSLLLYIIIGITGSLLLFMILRKEKLI
ncbi:MAG: thermonuclease family protein [Candidatus Gracilibacteria bacterium]